MVRRVVTVPKGGRFNLVTGDVTDKSGKVVSTERSRSSGGGVSRPSVRDQRLIEETRRIGRERLERLARESKARTDAAERARQKIINERRRMIDAKARIVRKTSKDKKTGAELRIIETSRGGVKIREIRNITTGSTRFERFAPGRAGGGRRLRTTIQVKGAFKPKEIRKEPITFKVDTKVTRLTPQQIRQVNRALSNETSRLQPNFSTKQFNASVQQLKQGNVTKNILNVADIVTGGFLTENKINNDQATLNTRVVKFNDKFGGRELTEEEFKKAETEQKFIDSEQTKIDKRTDDLVATKRNKWRDFLQKTKLQGTPRLTVAEQARIEQNRLNDKKIQRQIKTNQPTINNKQSQINSNRKEIKRLQSISNRTVLQDLKLFRLKNKNSGLQTDVARLEFTAPPKIVAGTIAIGGVTAPAGITKIKFVGTQQVGKDGKIVTDIFFKTNKGRTGVARGIRGVVSKDGKTVELVVGRSGKVAVNFPTGTEKLIKTQTFVALEEVSSKTKALKTVVNLTKNGQISVKRSKALKALITRTFKGDVSKVSLKKLQSTIAKSKKFKRLNLKKNLARLKRKGLISVIKVRRIGKKTARRGLIKRRIGRVPRRISPRRIARRFVKRGKVVKKVETITKEDFIRRIRSLRRVGDISAKLEKRLIKRIIRLSKKGKIPKSEFLKITRTIKKPKALRTSITPPTPSFVKIKKLDLRKNIRRLRRRGLISSKKAKQLRTVLRTKRPKKLIDFRKNLRRLQKRSIVTRAPRDTARQPGFGKIIKRLRNEALQAEKAGRLKRVDANLKFLEQRGVGKSFSVKGKKFFRPEIRFPSGRVVRKAVKGASKDDFISISAVLTKEDLSLIIGDAITRGKDKSQFIGLIKGGAKISESSFGNLQTKQQFGNALDKVLTKVSSAVAKAEKTKGLKTKSAQIAGAVALLSGASLTSAQKSTVRSATARVTIGRVVTRRPTQTIVRTRVQLNASRRRVKTLQRARSKIETKQKILTRTISKQKSRAKQLTKQKTKQKQILRQKIIQRLAQLQKQKTKLKTKQRLITKQITKAPTVITPFGTPIIIPPFKRKKKIIRKKKPLTKPVQVFDVFGKSRGKFVKLNVKPLTRGDALSKGAFAIDRTTSQTFKISPKGKSKTPGVLLKNERNYFKRQGFKLREVRIKRGRKFKLKQKFIEKRKFAIDTRSEKSGLSLRRHLIQRRKARAKASQKRKRAVRSPVRRLNRRKVTRTPPRRRMSPSQRKKMLLNLKKARRVRMKILKGGKRK